MYSLYDYIQLRINYFEHWLLNYIRTQKSSTFKSIETRDIRGSRLETRSSETFDIRDFRFETGDHPGQAKHMDVHDMF